MSTNCLFSFLVFSFTALAASTLSIQVRETKLRSAPQHTAPSVATLTYGQQVTPIGENGAWVQVSVPRQGWIHGSAVTTKSIKVATNRPVGSGVKGDEVALAGKGLGPDTERQYRGQHSDVEALFQKIDQIEQQSIPEAELQSFIKGGGLRW